MPVVSRFYGIVIKMFFSEHVGVYAIDSLEMLEGDLPPCAHRLVREWAEINKTQLRAMWDAKDFNSLPGLN